MTRVSNVLKGLGNKTNLTSSPVIVVHVSYQVSE